MFEAPGLGRIKTCDVGAFVVAKHPWIIKWCDLSTSLTHQGQNQSRPGKNKPMTQTFVCHVQQGTRRYLCTPFSTMTTRPHFRFSFPQILTGLLLGLTTLVANSQSIVVQGRITDSSTGEPIAGANVVDPVGGQGVSSLTDGTYSLKLPSGERTLICSFIGFEPARLTFKGTENVQWNIELKPDAIAVGTALVVGSAGQNTESTDLGEPRLPWKPSSASPL